eukprot:m.16810 g.16810  ORF g.16810 m.16810 type:complete len:112 (-) comp11217_c0_seq1:128-463(-)
MTAATNCAERSTGTFEARCLLLEGSDKPDFDDLFEELILSSCIAPQTGDMILSPPSDLPLDARFVARFGLLFMVDKKTVNPYNNVAPITCTLANGTCVLNLLVSNSYLASL